MTYRLIISDENAVRISEWFLEIPPGIRVWHSLDLGNLEQQWITPLDVENKPHWRACSRDEAEVITDPREVAVVALHEVERFPVELRVSGNGLALKLTDESNDELNQRLTAEGRSQYASYRFDYETQEALILDITGEPFPLSEFLPPAYYN